MKRINTAYLAEKVSGRFGMKLILGELVIALKQCEIIFVHFNHQRVLATADGAIAGSQFREISTDPEFDRTAVTATVEGLFRARAHLKVSLNSLIDCYRWLQADLLHAHQGPNPNSAHSSSTRCFTSALIAIGLPHCRCVSPGILLVASMPIFDPKPDTGEAKSR